MEATYTRCATTFNKLARCGPFPALLPRSRGLLAIFITVLGFFNLAVNFGGCRAMSVMGNAALYFSSSLKHFDLIVCV